MKKKTIKILSLVIPVILFSSFANATPFTPTVSGDFYSGVVNGIPTANDHSSSPHIYEAINRIMGTTYQHNYDVDHMFVDNDSVWSNMTGVLDIVGYSAWYINALGTYDASGEHEIITTSGSNYGWDTAAAMTFTVPSTGDFGWYLESINNNAGQNVHNKYYSDSTLNSDKMDHMMTFDLGGPFIYNGVNFENPYLIAWEDMALGDYGVSVNGVQVQTLGDEDYNDIIYLVDASPVPEPTTMLLFGTGLICLAGLGRRRSKKEMIG